MDRRTRSEVRLLVDCINKLCSGWSVNPDSEESVGDALPESLVAAMVGTVNLLNERLADVLGVRATTYTLTDMGGE